MGLIGGFEKVMDVCDGIGKVDHGPGVTLDGKVLVSVLEEEMQILMMGSGHSTIAGLKILLKCTDGKILLHYYVYRFLVLIYI